MADAREQLIRALVARLSEEECDALVNQARDEAIADVRRIVREALRDAFLEQVALRVSGAAGAGEEAPAPVAQLWAGEPEEAADTREPAAAPAAVPDWAEAAAAAAIAAPVVAATEAAGTPPPATAAAGEDDAEATRREIAEIRRRLAENERILAGAQPPDDLDDRLAAAEAAEVRETAGLGPQTGDGFYLYGVVQNGSPADGGLDVRGVDPERGPYLLPDGELTAVVSRVPLETFGEEALEDNLKDLGWVEMRVRAHHDVLQRVLASDSGLVPMQFCTIYRSEDRVREVLQAHRDDLLTAIGQLRGRREWGVKMYCGRAAARLWARQHGAAVGELEDKIAAASAGAAYLLSKKLDETLDDEVERVTDAAAQASHDALSGVAVEATVLPLRDADEPGADVMIMNAAYLVEEAQMQRFEAELERLGAEYEALGCSYELTGPWPAYNFVSAGVEQGGDA